MLLLLRLSELPALVSPVPRKSGRQMTAPPASSAANSSERASSVRCLPARPKATTTGDFFWRFPSARRRTSGTTIPSSTSSNTRSIATLPNVLVVERTTFKAPAGVTSPSNHAQSSRSFSRRSAASNDSNRCLAATIFSVASLLASRKTGCGSTLFTTAVLRHISSFVSRRC